MKKRASTKTYIKLVKVYYLKAECILRATGKEYYHIIDRTLPISLLGVGKTVGEAWQAAYRNVYSDK